MIYVNELIQKIVAYHVEKNVSCFWYIQDTNVSEYQTVNIKFFGASPELLTFIVFIHFGN